MKVNTINSFPPLSEGTKLFFPYLTCDGVSSIQEDTIKLVDYVEDFSQEGEANTYVYTLESGEVISHCRKDKLPFGWYLNKEKAEDRLREEFNKIINEWKWLLEQWERDLIKEELN